MSTQDQLNAIEEAIANGELSVSYLGRSTTYRSMDELLQAYQHLIKKLRNEAAGTANRLYPRYQVANLREG